MPVSVTKLKRSIMNETTVKDIAPLNLIWTIILLISIKLSKIGDYCRMLLVFFSQKSSECATLLYISPDAGTNDEDWKITTIHKQLVYWGFVIFTVMQYTQRNTSKHYWPCVRIIHLVKGRALYGGINSWPDYSPHIPLTKGLMASSWQINTGLYIITLPNWETIIWVRVETIDWIKFMSRSPDESDWPSIDTRGLTHFTWFGPTNSGLNFHGDPHLAFCNRFLNRRVYHILLVSEYLAKWKWNIITAAP